MGITAAQKDGNATPRDDVVVPSFEGLPFDLPDTVDRDCIDFELVIGEGYDGAQVALSQLSAMR
jgi:hypothetical protein